MTRLFALTIACILTAGLFAGLTMAQTLPGAELIANDFLKFIVFLPRNTVEWACLVAAWLGVVAHWWNKRRLGEYLGNLWGYLAADSPKWTLATGLVIYVAIMAALSSGLISQASIPGAIVGGLIMGWVIDSLVAPKASA